VECLRNIYPALSPVYKQKALETIGLLSLCSMGTEDVLKVMTVNKLSESTDPAVLSSSGPMRVNMLILYAKTCLDSNKRNLISEQ